MKNIKVTLDQDFCVNVSYNVNSSDIIIPSNEEVSYGVIVISNIYFVSLLSKFYDHKMFSDFYYILNYYLTTRGSNLKLFYDSFYGVKDEEVYKLLKGII